MAGTGRHELGSYYFRPIICDLHTVTLKNLQVVGNSSNEGKRVPSEEILSLLVVIIISSPSAVLHVKIQHVSKS